MRASATSRTAPPADIHAAQAHAAQAKANTNKMDEASPFALLVESATSKATPSPSQKDASDSGDKRADDKAVARQNNRQDNRQDTKQDDNNDATQASQQPSGKTAQPAKTEKAGKREEDADAKTDNAASDAADSVPVATADPMPVNPQPPVPVVQTAVAAPGTDDSDDLQIDAAAPAAGTQAPAAAAPPPATPAVPAAQAQADATAQLPVDAAAPTPANPAAPETAQTDNKQTKDAAAQAEAAAQSPATPSELKQTAPRENAAKPGAAKVAANDKTASSASTKLAASKDDASRNDTAKGDADRTVESKPVPQQVETVAGSETSAPKSAPPQVQAINTNLAVHDLVAPQALQPGSAPAPVTTQHIQVSAQAAPNVPALAVEIAAKSQSGAKQFDIRLDPPELGRVEVRLSIDATGKASAHLSADQPQTLALLQKDAPMLARALREAGLDVSQDGLNFSLRQQANGHDSNPGNHGRRGSSRAFALTATSSIESTASTAAWRGRNDGRLDISV